MRFSPPNSMFDILLILFAIPLNTPRFSGQVHFFLVNIYMLLLFKILNQFFIVSFLSFLLVENQTDIILVFLLLLCSIMIPEGCFDKPPLYLKCCCCDIVIRYQGLKAQLCLGTHWFTTSCHCSRLFNPKGYFPVSMIL